ncbi:KilA-N domain-containing protein [Eikenella sp. NML03-A-027]|uniref:KilA-N domain-containing protein n=1 Tax=Eikenella sp. NML03-A-027 TaxID=1795828 RepID=UPI0009ED88E1|nr:KilA-N domain-containing protein [Eikenella sp. NML03-A-027]
MELVDEVSKSENPALKENQQVIQIVHGGSKRGTYACKELVYAYATWISAKFFLQVIRTFDAVISGSLHAPEALPSAQTTIDERRGLVDAVKLLVARCGIDYSAAYRMVHQRFGVAHIDQIAAPLLPSAVAYVHSLALQGRHVQTGEMETVPKLFANQANIPFNLNRNAYYAVTVKGGKIYRHLVSYITSPYEDGMIPCLAHQV